MRDVRILGIYDTLLKLTKKILETILSKVFWMTCQILFCTGNVFWENLGITDTLYKISKHILRFLGGSQNLVMHVRCSMANPRDLRHPSQITQANLPRIP